MDVVSVFQVPCSAPVQKPYRYLICGKSEKRDFYIISLLFKDVVDVRAGKYSVWRGDAVKCRSSGRSAAWCGRGDGGPFAEETENLTRGFFQEAQERTKSSFISPQTKKKINFQSASQSCLLAAWV